MRRALPLLAAGLVLVPAAPASAAGAERAGWWNRASAGTVALPAATTMAGDLRVVTGAPDAPSAYAALLLTAPGSRTARLVLTVRAGSALGTPEVVACPTETDDWPEGDNQPIETAPAYDCVVGLAFGSLSADGTTLSFDLDDSTQVSDGVWSLALVPSPESAAPFAVDLQPPGDGAFTPAAPEPSAEPERSAAPAPVEAPAPDLLLPGTAAAPPDLGGVPDLAAAPLLAGTLPEAAPAPAAAAPVVPQLAGTAPRPALSGPVLARPVASVVPDDQRERLLALLLLVALSTAVGYAAGRDRPGPRLIGGRAGSAAAAAAPPPAPVAAPRERGIGRFARPRDAAPRRLR